MYVATAPITLNMMAPQANHSQQQILRQQYEHEENLLHNHIIPTSSQYGLIRIKRSEYAPGGNSYRIIFGGEASEELFSKMSKYLLEEYGKNFFGRRQYIFYKCVDRGYRDISYKFIKNNNISHINLTIYGGDGIYIDGDKKLQNYFFQNCTVVTDFMNYNNKLYSKQCNLRQEYYDVFGKHHNYIFWKKTRIRKKLRHQKLFDLKN